MRGGKPSPARSMRPPDSDLGRGWHHRPPRPDARHITYADVRALRPVVHTEFNIEGYPSPDFVDLVLEVARAGDACPRSPRCADVQCGVDTLSQGDLLRPVLAQFRDAGIRTSLFIETDGAHSHCGGARCRPHRIVHRSLRDGHSNLTPKVPSPPSPKPPEWPTNRGSE